MDKINVFKTQEMWKDYPNAKYWIETISNPAEHMHIEDNKIIFIDGDYYKAIESLTYILGQECSGILDGKELA
jgi:negative regulator of replication initiation